MCSILFFSRPKDMEPFTVKFEGLSVKVYKGDITVANVEGIIADELTDTGTKAI